MFLLWLVKHGNVVCVGCHGSQGSALSVLSIAAGHAPGGTGTELSEGEAEGLRRLPAGKTPQAWVSYEVSCSS